MGWVTGQVHEDSGRAQPEVAARAGCLTEPPTAARTAIARRKVTHRTARVDISNKLVVAWECYQGKFACQSCVQPGAGRVCRPHSPIDIVDASSAWPHLPGDMP